MRRTEKKAIKRKRILEAAVKVFARDGFHEARISDIAREAGVGHGTVYLYFESKEAILLTIFGELMGQALSEVRIAAEHGQNAIEKLRCLLRAQIQMVEENRALTELLLVETRSTGKFLSSEAIRRVADYIGFIREILEEGIDEGLVRPDIDVETVATFIFAGIDGVLTRWLLEEPGYALQHQIGSILDVLLRGICTPTDARHKMSGP